MVKLEQALKRKKLTLAEFCADHGASTLSDVKRLCETAGYECPPDKVVKAALPKPVKKPAKKAVESTPMYNSVPPKAEKPKRQRRKKASTKSPAK